MFELDAEYKRRDLHNEYGGQRQGGISTPSDYDLMMLFTGETGHQYGYEDQWSDDGLLFYYTGEGQRGDMRFVRGNLAIRDHKANGKDIHLFQAADKGYVQYIGQMECTGYHERLGNDVDGNERKLIIFELIPIGIQVAEDYESPEGRRLLSTHIKRERKPNLVRRKKKQVLAQKGELRCEVCRNNPDEVYGELGKAVIECHHRVPLSQLEQVQRTRLSDLSLVCANCHRVLHASKPLMLVEELNGMLNE